MNGIFRDFFKNNAWAIFVWIVTGVVSFTIFYMTAKGTAEGFSDLKPRVEVLEKKQERQEEINITFKEDVKEIKSDMKLILREMRRR